MPEDFGYLVFLNVLLFSISLLVMRLMYQGLSGRIAKQEHRVRPLHHAPTRRDTSDQDTPDGQ